MKIFLVLLIYLSFNAKAENSCGKDKIDLYYANGMSNDFIEAQQSALILKDLYNKKFSFDKVSKIRVAFNSNENWLTQLNQVLKQKISKLKISIWTYLNSNLIKDTEFNTAIKKSLSDSFKDLDIDLSSQIDNYYKSLNNLKNVVTVAHSQGNFYTNLAFHQMDSDQTHMISVATPDSEVYKSNPPLYFTFTNDLVIKYIPNSLKANVTPAEPSGMNHSFINNYINDNIVKNKILDNINYFYMHAKNEIKGFKPTDAYYNSELNNLLDWFTKIKESNDKISDSECLLVSTIFYAFEFHDIKCHERNANLLSKMLNDCEKDINSKFNTDTTLCPFYSGLKIYDNRSTQIVNSEIENFYMNHKECEFGYSDFENKNINIVKEARNKLLTINAPTEEILDIKN